MRGKIKDRLKEESGKFKSVGWRGILIGFALSVAVAPIISGFVTPAYVSMGIYSEPQFQTSVKQVDSPYTPGVRAGKFGNITWEEGFEVYRVRFKHAGGPPVDRAVFEVRFPGCVRQASGTGEGNGDITVSSPLKPEIYTTNRTDAEVLQCRVQISTETINENEGYRLEFVVDHDHDRCDLLSSYNPNKKYLVEYQWSKKGVPLDGRVIGDVEGADNQYETSQLPSNSTKLVEKGGYSAFIYGAGNGDDQKALKSCFE